MSFLLILSQKPHHWWWLWSSGFIHFKRGWVVQLQFFSFISISSQRPGIFQSKGETGGWKDKEGVWRNKQIILYQRHSHEVAYTILWIRSRSWWFIRLLTQLPVDQISNASFCLVGGVCSLGTVLENWKGEWKDFVPARCKFFCTANTQLCNLTFLKQTFRSAKFSTFSGSPQAPLCPAKLDCLPYRQQQSSLEENEKKTKQTNLQAPKGMNRNKHSQCGNQCWFLPSDSHSVWPREQHWRVPESRE